jgi:solute carrier family 39 (zinc transporter), member 1/2/3
MFSFYIKLSANFIILLVALAGGLFPILVKVNGATKKWLVYGESFAGGIFLGAGLIHLLPDAQESFNAVIQSNYPFVFLICAFSILFLYVIEEGAIKLLTCRNTECTHAQFQPWLAYLLVILLSIHSVLAGIALGIETALASFIIIFIAIIVHKGSAAFALGVSMRREGLAKNSMMKLMILFSLMTPLGIIFGSVLSSFLKANPGHLAEAAFNAIAAGTFIYMAFHIIKVKDEERCVSTLSRLTNFFLGLVVMAVIAVGL